MPIKPTEQEESPIEVSEDIETIDNTIIKVTFPISKTTWKKLGEVALKRETSRASIMREAIKRHLIELEEPSEQTVKISDRQLDRILEENTETKEGFFSSSQTFNIDGFIDDMEAKNFKLKNLSPDQWKKVKTKINMGDFPTLEDGKPNFKGLAEMFKDLEPSKEQYEWLSTETGPEED